MCHCSFLLRSPNTDKLCKQGVKAAATSPERVALRTTTPAFAGRSHRLGGKAFPDVDSHFQLSKPPKDLTVLSSAVECHHAHSLRQRGERGLYSGSPRPVLNSPDCAHLQGQETPTKAPNLLKSPRPGCSPISSP